MAPVPSSATNAARTSIHPVQTNHPVSIAKQEGTTMTISWMPGDKGGQHHLITAVARVEAEIGAEAEVTSMAEATIAKEKMERAKIAVNWAIRTERLQSKPEKYERTRPTPK